MRLEQLRVGEHVVRYGDGLRKVGEDNLKADVTCLAPNVHAQRKEGEKGRTWTWSGLVTAKLTRRNMIRFPGVGIALRTRLNQPQKHAMPKISSRRKLYSGEEREGTLVTRKM